MANEKEVFRVLRVFGLPQERVVEILRNAKNDGCIGLQLMENAGEYAVVIRGRGETADLARFYCLQWEERLNQAFGDSVFGADDQTLPKASVEALRRRRLMVAGGSPRAVRILTDVMGKLPGAHGVFDFGSEGKAVAGKLAKKCSNKGRSALGFAGWQAACLHKLGEADLVVNCCPGYALIYDGTQAVACPLPADASDLLAANTMLDLARRSVLGLNWPEGAFTFKPSAGQNEPGHRGNTHRRKKKKSIPLFSIVTGLLGLALLGGIIFALWQLLHPVSGGPESKGYGTLNYDAQATAYLEKSMEKDPAVAGWLALPAAEGRLVYATQAEEGERPYLVAWGGKNANTLVALEQGSAPDWRQLDEQVKENGSFTLFTAGETLGCKVAAVYYYDEQDEAAPFDPAAYQALSDESEYRDFVVGIKARSLYDTGVNIGDGDSFVTLLLGTNDTGGKLAVTGRVIRPGESAAWSAANIRTASAPLYTSAQYSSQGVERPDIATVNEVWQNWYQHRNTIVETVGTEAAPMSQIEGIDISALANQTAELLSDADSVMSGLTDVAGVSGATVSDVNQGAGGSLSDADVSVMDALREEEKLPEPPAPQAPEGNLATEEAPAEGENMDGVGNEGDAPGEVVSGEGRTIDVTMNGVAQTMDLVQCLAMIAQNELGNNQPVEAYKAQAVAAHSWILSQGSYPSVAGIAPSATVLEAVRQVATVLVTYNGKVCFTPYCASVSTGTVSCKDVWGNDRAYLQAVESPYDKQYSRNWNTNGNSSGTARYSRETVKNRVMEKLGIDLSAIDDPNQWFTVLERNPFGYVTQMQIGNDASGSTTCSGRWFRENLLIYQSVDGRTLRSCAFSWEFNSDLDCYIFDVYGYGHGVGMSQWGCIGYAYNGWTYDQILQHYYVGTSLVSY